MALAFVEADRDYRDKLEATGDLASAFAAACAVGKVDLNGTGSHSRHIGATEHLLHGPRTH